MNPVESTPDGLPAADACGHCDANAAIQNQQANVDVVLREVFGMTRTSFMEH